jgi:pimeloyl-ACP methyl ester carboxylesterase
MAKDRFIDRKFIRIGTRMVHYRTIGDASMPPLFMMHASPASSGTLEGLMHCLADDYYVIAPDTPGNGLSDALEHDSPAMADYAAGADALAEALGLGQITVYGTHTGAHVAIEWAKTIPQRIERLVLDGVALMDAAERQEFLENYAPPKKPEPDGSQFHWAWGFMRDQMIFYPHYKKDLQHLRPGGTFDAQVLHGLTLDILGSLETYHLAYEAVFRQDVLASAAQVAHKTLVLTSDDGPIESGMEPLIEALQNPSTTQTSGADGEKAAAIKAFLTRA